MRTHTRRQLIRLAALHHVYLVLDSASNDLLQQGPMNDFERDVDVIACSKIVDSFAQTAFNRYQRYKGKLGYEKS